MSNALVVRQPKVHTLMLGGQEREVKFDLNAFVALEEEYGDISGALKAMQTGNIKAIRAILWCGLVFADDTLTTKDVGAMISVASLEKVMNDLTVVLTEAMAEDKPVQDGATGTTDPK